MRLSLATIMMLLPLAGAGCAADYGNDNVCGVSHYPYAHGRTRAAALGLSSVDPGWIINQLKSFIEAINKINNWWRRSLECAAGITMLTASELARMGGI